MSFAALLVIRCRFYFLINTTGACSASRIFEKKDRTVSYLSAPKTTRDIVTERVKCNLLSFTSYLVVYFPN